MVERCGVADLSVDSNCFVLVVGQLLDRGAAMEEVTVRAGMPESSSKGVKPVVSHLTVLKANSRRGPWESHIGRWSFGST